MLCLVRTVHVVIPPMHDSQRSRLARCGLLRRRQWTAGRVQAKRTAISNSLGPLGPSIMALLERDPVQRMTIREARPLWVEVLRGALAE